jgi:hypothetical protein
MIEIFRTYKKNGLACLPTKDDKSPNVSSWKGGVDEESLYENSYGIGIICGKLSDGVECIDFDNKFSDAKEIISQYLNIDEVKEIYEKYKLPVESTINGGFHLLFRCTKNLGNQKLARRPLMDEETKKWKPVCIIETRGEGGYFVAAPTKGYLVIRNDIVKINHITEEDRDILISNAKSFNEWIDKTEYEFEQKDRPGDKYNQELSSLDDVKSELISKGWKELRKGIWQRPNKGKGISATLGYKANIFYNFSSNAYPFEIDKGYTPFQVIGLLKYNGDFKSLAKDLADRYGMNEQIDYKKKSEKKEVSKTDDDWKILIKKLYIDLKIPIERPPIILRIGNIVNGVNYKQRLFTLGNFSAITGKGKSKKTYLAALMSAALVKNGNEQDKFYGSLPSNKRWVLRFDTEQSDYDAYVSSKQIERLVGYESDYFGAFDLRDLNAIDRCGFIDYTLKTFKENIGCIIIDGIADLVKTINDEDEASRVITLLMQWSKQYNCHIINIIHQNKNDNFATGWIGSGVIKKSEAIISVEKIEGNPVRSTIHCDNIRGVGDFDDFQIEISSDGLPVVIEDKIVQYTKEIDF